MNTQDILSFAASGGTGSYSWDVGAVPFADGATVGPSGLQVDTGTTVDYLSRITAYQSNTFSLSSGASTINMTIITYDPMDLSPITATIAVNGTQQFTNAFGYCSGVPGACTNAATTWSVVSGLGSISASGLFTATSSAGTTVIQAADSIGSVATATITVSNTLSISPATLKIPIYSTGIFSGILGTQPYTYSVFSGSGTLGCSSTLTGTHTAGTTTINVTNTTGCPTQGTILVGT